MSWRISVRQRQDGAKATFAQDLACMGTNGLDGIKRIGCRKQFGVWKMDRMS
jgi:hypothetical protein